MSKQTIQLPLGEMVKIGLLAAFTAVLSYVTIPLPFSPVPITAATFGVMVAGSLLGAKAGFLSMVLYLLIGSVGVPVFAGGQGGVGVLAGPTGGYLLGYPIAAYVIGMFNAKKEKKGLGSHIMANLIGGILVVYLMGVGQLALLTGIGLGAALTSGVLPFLLGDIVKVLVASLITQRVQSGVLMLGNKRD